MEKPEEYLYTDDASLRPGLRRAALEGRLPPDMAAELGLESGRHVCPVCGMLNWTEYEAAGCCIDLANCGTRAEAIANMPKRAGDAYGGVVWPDEFASGLIALMEQYGVMRADALAHRTGLSRNFTQRALKCEVAWIGHRNWEILMLEFDGDVPGCEKWPFE